MTWADSGEEKQELEEGERETDRACDEGEEVEAQKELKEGDTTAAGETRLKEKKDVESETQLEEVTPLNESTWRESGKEGRSVKTEEEETRER